MLGDIQSPLDTAAWDSSSLIPAAGRQAAQPHLSWSSLAAARLSCSSRASLSDPGQAKRAAPAQHFPAHSYFGFTALVAIVINP